MLDFLPKRIGQALSHINSHFLYEIRIRAGKPICIYYKKEYYFLGVNGISEDKNALIVEKKEIEELIFAASEYSIYSVEEQIKQGFLTTKCGERMGLAGIGICEAGQVINIREISSVCIRIPHAVLNCSERIAPYCFFDNIYNTLISAPPGYGKTTILRDVGRVISNSLHKNVVFIDERGEFGSFDTGIMSDIVQCIDKRQAIPYAIRAMKPDVLITDEIFEQDYSVIDRAIQSGVKIFASAHFFQMQDVVSLSFQRYVFLSGLGQVGSIWSNEAKQLYG